MKKISLIITILYLLSFSNKLFAQSQVYGSWTVSCLVEKTSIASIKACGICETGRKDQSCINIEDFEMEINKDELTILQSQKKEILKYSYDSNLDVIKFIYKGIEYKFTIIQTYDKGSLLLKNEDCLILYLKKKS